MSPCWKRNRASDRPAPSEAGQPRNRPPKFQATLRQECRRRRRRSPRAMGHPSSRTLKLNQRPFGEKRPLSSDLRGCRHEHLLGLRGGRWRQRPECEFGARQYREARKTTQEWTGRRVSSHWAPERTPCLQRRIIRSGPPTSLTASAHSPGGGRSGRLSSTPAFDCRATTPRAPHRHRTARLCSRRGRSATSRRGCVQRASKNMRRNDRRGRARRRQRCPLQASQARPCRRSGPMSRRRGTPTSASIAAAR